MSPPSLLMQTTYAELLDRCRATAFHHDFPQEGTFVSKSIRGKRYWYFQQSTEAGRRQRYVGPEAPDLLEQISQHRQFRDDERERRALVSTLIRSFALPRPIPEIGNIVAALAKAGIFRLRGVLIGTVAYQTYSPMLGTRLPLSVLQTGDVDIAQFKDVSVAVEDRTPPIVEVLKEVDKTFRPVPHVHNQRHVTSYIAKGGLRVDFLTPNKGADTDEPQPLPAFQTDAEPLRFLDFLIREPEPAVLLHGAGIYVLVPSPQRFAVHKLIVSRRRREGAAKQDKDIRQAAALLDVLVEKRPYELKGAWHEASGRGKTWRRLLIEGLSHVPAATRDSVLKIIGEKRNIFPGIDLAFNNSSARYDGHHHTVTFNGEALGNVVKCIISREALDYNLGTARLSKEERLEKFRQSRSVIESMMREKYLHWPVELPEIVLVTSKDFSKLKRTIAAREAAH